MVHLRFSSLLLGLMLSLVVALGVPSPVLANKLEATSTKNDQALGNVQKLGNEMEMEMVAGTPSGRLKGRKMGVGDVSKKEVRNEMNTSANLSHVGKCSGHGEKGESSLECMLMSDRGLMGNRGLASRFSLVGVIPFSSDYHAPKGHPPKHN